MTRWAIERDSDQASQTRRIVEENDSECVIAINVPQALAGRIVKEHNGDQGNHPTPWQYYKAAAIPGLAATGGYDVWRNLIADAESIADAAVEGDQVRNEGLSDGGTGLEQRGTPRRDRGAARG